MRPNAENRVVFSETFYSCHFPHRDALIDTPGDDNWQCRYDADINDSDVVGCEYTELPVDTDPYIMWVKSEIDAPVE